MDKCLYCEKGLSDHFFCENCGDGMCNDCYDAETEHDRHYNFVMEIADSKNIIKLTKQFGKNPDYICEICIEKALRDEL